MSEKPLYYDHARMLASSQQQGWAPTAALSTKRTGHHKNDHRTKWLAGWKENVATGDGDGDGDGCARAIVEGVGVDAGMRTGEGCQSGCNELGCSCIFVGVAPTAAPAVAANAVITVATAARVGIEPSTSEIESSALASWKSSPEVAAVSYAVSYCDNVVCGLCLAHDVTVEMDDATSATDWSANHLRGDIHGGVRMNRQQLRALPSPSSPISNKEKKGESTDRRGDPSLALLLRLRFPSVPPPFSTTKDAVDMSEANEADRSRSCCSNPDWFNSNSSSIGLFGLSFASTPTEICP
jgi:hypothetical protein